MSDYTVHLEQLFRGPADLLLQLCKDEELDVKAVPLARVCEGFLRHLQDVAKSDLEDAADFLVVASTLLWLKSHSILPHETVDLEEELAGKDDLLTRLLEYRRFRSASQALGKLAGARDLRFERGERERLEEGEPEVDLAEVSSWTLLENFSRLMKETLYDRPHVLKGDPKPLRLYATEIVEKLKSLKTMTFAQLFEGVKGRDPVIGYFIALLELAKQGVVGVEQKEPFGAIELGLKEEGLTSLNFSLFGQPSGDAAHG